jgi:hypothetical protein
MATNATNRVCPTCAGPVDPFGRHVTTNQPPALEHEGRIGTAAIRHQQEEANAARITAAADQLMADDKTGKLSYGDAVRGATRQIEDRAQQKAEAERAGVSAAQIDRAHQLTARAERLVRDSGGAVSFSDAIRKVVADPLLSQVVRQYEHGQ